jgi:hypothetical protein
VIGKEDDRRRKVTGEEVIAEEGDRRGEVTGAE